MKLDIGCGKNKQQGFIGVDAIAFEGVDLVCDLLVVPWTVKQEIDWMEHIDGDAQHPIWSQFKDESVEQVHCSHFLEHLTGEERIPFFNELFRVMKKGAQANFVTPHWSHDCAYGDPTHKWPPVSGWTFMYLNKAWRDMNAPHVGYTCDFDWVIGGSWDEWLNVRNQETKTFAMQRYINSYRDIIVTLTKR